MTALVALLLAGMAAEPSAAVNKGIEGAIERGRVRATELRDELKRAKRGLVLESKRDRSRIELEKKRAASRRRANKDPLTKPRRMEFETREKKDERVAELAKLLAAAAAMPKFPKARGAPGPGDCGKIESDSFKVLQIAGPRDVRGEIRWYHGRTMKIDGLTQQIPITTVRAKPLEVWLTGVDTEDMVEGEICEVTEPIVVLASKKQFTPPFGVMRSVAAGRALTAEEIQRITKELASPE